VPSGPWVEWGLDKITLNYMRSQLGYVDEHGRRRNHSKLEEMKKQFCPGIVTNTKLNIFSNGSVHLAHLDCAAIFCTWHFSLSTHCIILNFQLCLQI
jgi:hypothetical protein